MITYFSGNRFVFGREEACIAWPKFALRLSHSELFRLSAIMVIPWRVIYYNYGSAGPFIWTIPVNTMQLDTRFLINYRKNCMVLLGPPNRGTSPTRATTIRRKHEQIPDIVAYVVSQVMGRLIRNS